MTNPDQWIEALEPYPLTLTCFGRYLRWLAQREDIIAGDNDLISVLEKNSRDRLALLEQHLRDSRDTLGMSDKRFRDAFFGNDLLTDDPEKVHDVLTEPALVRDLAGHGFTDITKLPPFLKDGQQRYAAADFTARRSGKKYAIELKSVRPENNPKPRSKVPTGNAMIPYWWGTMFRNNVLTKIEAKECKVLTQLRNTVRLLNCDRAILAVYTRRMGPSALMGHEDYERELTEIRKQYSQIDHVFMKDYGDRVVVCPPFNAQQGAEGDAVTRAP